MAFIHDDMAEVVLRIVLGKKKGIFFICANIERLIGGNQNSCILLRISTGDFGSICTKNILEMVKTLGSEFIPITNK